MMNPEFKRNLWLSFSRHKLIAMPVLLGLSFLAAAVSKHHWLFDNVYFTAIALFIFIVWLWGARNANASIVDELRDKTWDQQRMSALGPWSMTWGKLLGSTAFNWYGGAICLAVAIPAALLAGNPYWYIDLPTLVTTAIMTHSALIALNMHSGLVDMRLMQRGGLGWIAIIFILVFSLIIIDQVRDGETVVWWGTSFSLRLFMLISTFNFAIIFTFGAWRVISNTLQVRTLPWSWPLFSLFLGCYFAGFFNQATVHTLYFLSHCTLLVAGIMTYATLFTEPARLTDWHRLRLRLNKHDWKGLLQYLPLWPSTMLLTFCLAIPALIPASGNLRISDWGESLVYYAPLGFAFMLLRDACILLFFSFSPKYNRPAATALLYIVVLDYLLPFLFSAMGLHTLSFFISPHTGMFNTTAASLVLATHATIGMGLVTWRLKKSETRETAKA